MPFNLKPIKFGTDGWRGIIGADFTFERVAQVAPVAAQVLAENYGSTTQNNCVIVGYDRRFMAEDYAQIAAEAIQETGFEVLLSQSYAPTPAFSWAAKSSQALGAIVLTASHNPAKYLGLKVKGAFGGSVSPEITQQIEARLSDYSQSLSSSGTIAAFDPWLDYCQQIRSQIDIKPIREAIASGKLTVYADVMHGAAATGLERILGCPIIELNSDRDPLFAGGAPEPLPRYLGKILQAVKADSSKGLKVGLVFDGDADRIAAVDGDGNFLSSQILVPILIEHLAARKGLTGEVVKTVSGSDLMPLLAKLYNLPLYETPVGYKYIADRMLTAKVLIGGEESGGIGYGSHIPERDALLSALYILEAIVESKQDLGSLYTQLQSQVQFTSAYDRLDLALANMDIQSQILASLKTKPPTEIAGQAVINCLTLDGYKFRAADGRWLLIRFSGTEPVLRIYCEGSTPTQVQETLAWAEEWAKAFS